MLVRLKDKIESIEIMNVCTQFNDNLYNTDWYISLWMMCVLK